MTRSPFDRIAEQIALDFDDVLLVPALSNLTPDTVRLQTKFSQNIILQTPFISSPMETVTHTQMAIAMAQLGGIGVLHRHMSVGQQADKVAKVKKFQARIVRDIVMVTAETPVIDVMEMQQRYDLAGLPVIDPSTKVLIGFVTRDHIKDIEDISQSVGNLMQKDGLNTVASENALQSGYDLMKEKNIPYVIVLDEKNRCVGLITQGDKDKFETFPSATVDEDGRLRVAAAVGIGADHFDRVGALIDAGADALYVDGGHGHSKAVLDMVTHIRRQRAGHVDVIAGNVATLDAAAALIDAGANAIRVGVGAGSICMTRKTAGVGVPQISAIMAVSDACSVQNIPVLADGGMKHSGDVAKALAAGASATISGSFYAGTDEAPGESVEQDGKKYKFYRDTSQSGTAETRIPHTGSITDAVKELEKGVRLAMSYTGCATIDELRTQPRFIRVR